jgi:hypothetical protein
MGSASRLAIGAVCSLAAAASMWGCGGRPAPAAPAERRLELFEPTSMLPTELADFVQPEAPRTVRDVQVSSAAELEHALLRPGTLIHVRGAIPGNFSTASSDLAIVGDDGARLGTLLLLQGAQRIELRHLELAGVELAPPALFDEQGAHYDPARMVQDVHIADVRVDAPDSAFVLRGRRVRIERAQVHAARYALWAGDTGPLDGSDLWLSDAELSSEGAEATVRIHDVLRSVVVRNTLSNGAKHAYRVHGRSDLAYAAHNLLLHTGVMIGTQPGDSVGFIRFEDNELRTETPSLFELDVQAIRTMIVQRNRAFNDTWNELLPYQVPPSWLIVDNTCAPYTPR